MAETPAGTYISIGMAQLLAISPWSAGRGAW